MKAFAMALGRSYRSALANHPFTTNLATAVPLMVIGDVAAQSLESRDGKNGLGKGSMPFEWDSARTGVMASYSAFIFTPTFLTLYRWLDRTVGQRNAFVVALQKSAASVVLGGVPVNTGLLVMATSVEMLILGKRPGVEGSEVHRSSDGERGGDAVAALRDGGAEGGAEEGAGLGGGGSDADDDGKLVLSIIGSKLRYDLPEIMASSACYWGPINVANFYFTPPQYRIIVASCAAVVWNIYLSCAQHRYLHDEGSSIGDGAASTLSGVGDDDNTEQNNSRYS